MSQPATTPRFRALGHDFDVTTPDPALTTHLTRLFGRLEAGAGPARRHYELTGPDAEGCWETRCDGVPVDAPAEPARAVALLLWRINRGVIEDTDDLVLFHAGAVVVDGVGVLLPGDVAVGKSTLVAGLLRAGADYLSDEAVGLALDDDVLHGYGKPVSLDAGSWDLLSDLRPDVPDPLRARLPDQWQVRPEDVPGVTFRSSMAPGVVVLLQYREGADTSVRRLRGSEALVALAACTFRPAVGRVASLERLARLVERVPCHALTHGSLAAAIEVVGTLAREPSGDASASGHAGVPSGPDRPGDRPATPGPAPADPDHAARPRVDTTLVRVEDEAVVHDAERDELHRLNATGALVWDRLDGRTVREVAAELARTFDVPVEQVTADVARFVGELAARGLLATG